MLFAALLLHHFGRGAVYAYLRTTTTTRGAARGSKGSSRGRGRATVPLGLLVIQYSRVAPRRIAVCSLQEVHMHLDVSVPVCVCVCVYAYRLSALRCLLVAVVGMAKRPNKSKCGGTWSECTATKCSCSHRYRYSHSYSYSYRYIYSYSCSSQLRSGASLASGSRPHWLHSRIKPSRVANLSPKEQSTETAEGNNRGGRRERSVRAGRGQ